MLLCNQSEIPVTVFFISLKQFLSSVTVPEESQVYNLWFQQLREKWLHSRYFISFYSRTYTSQVRDPHPHRRILFNLFFYQQSKLLLNSYGLKSFSFCGPKLRNELSSELRAIESVFLRLSWEYIFLRHILINPHKFIPPPWYWRGGGSVEKIEPLTRVFDMLRYFEKIFQWKAFDLLNKMKYILWVVAPLETCDVTNNDRHLGLYF